MAFHNCERARQFASATTATCAFISSSSSLAAQSPSVVDRYHCENCVLHFKFPLIEAIYEFSPFFFGSLSVWNEQNRHWITKLYIFGFCHTDDPYPHLQLVGMLESRECTLGHRRTRAYSLAHKHKTRQVHLFRSINFVRLACISTLYVALDAIQASSSSRCAIKLNWRGMHSPSSSDTVIHLCHNAIKSSLCLSPFATRNAVRRWDGVRTMSHNQQAASSRLINYIPIFINWLMVIWFFLLLLLWCSYRLRVLASLDAAVASGSISPLHLTAKSSAITHLLHKQQLVHRFERFILYSVRCLYAPFSSFSVCASSPSSSGWCRVFSTY